MKSNWNYPTTVWTGEDRSADLPEACLLAKINSPLFVTDKNLIALPMTIKIINNLKNFGINFDVKTSKSTVDVWGSGKVKRELLNVDDMASATLFILGLDKAIYLLNTKPMISHINIGTGSDISIIELVNSIKKIVNYKGNIRFDTSKPEGPNRKLIETSRLKKIGWSYDIKLEEGLKETYAWYIR